MSRFLNVKTIALIFTIIWLFFAIQFSVSIKSYEYNNQHSTFLINCCKWTCGVEFLLLTIFMIGTGIFFIKFDQDCIEKWMIIIWATFVIVAFIALEYQFQAFDKDIQYRDYEVYYGDFEKDTTRGFVFLNDTTNTRLYNSHDTYLEPGYYYGEIVYSKRTKYVLSYELTLKD